MVSQKSHQGFKLRPRSTLNPHVTFHAGVSILAVGVANADLQELRKVAAPARYKNVFFSPTFDDFPSIEREFIGSVCGEELRSEFKLRLDEEVKGERFIFVLEYHFSFTRILFFFDSAGHAHR